MPGHRWYLTDPVTAATYTFHINPLSGGSPQREKTITEETTTAGGVVLYEGADVPMRGSVSGTILDLAHYQAFTTWWAKRYPVTMTDDLGRVQTIYITKFAPERQRSQRRYKHQYTLEWVVLATTDL